MAAGTLAILIRVTKEKEKRRVGERESVGSIPKKLGL